MPVGMTVRERVARIRDEITGVAAQYGVTQWEKGFLDNVERQHALSEKQETTLRNIEAKVFAEEADDE